MQSAGSMYFSKGGGGGGEGKGRGVGFALQHLLQFYMQTLHDAIRCAFVGLQIGRPHFELCIADLGLCMVQACGLQSLQAIAGCSYSGPMQSAGPMNFSIRGIYIT